MIIMLFVSGVVGIMQGGAMWEVEVELSEISDLLNRRGEENNQSHQAKVWFSKTDKLKSN